MTEKDVHQLIEEQTPELKKLVYEHIREDAERSVTEGAKRRQRRKRLAVRLCSVAAAFVLVAVCLSVVLPIVLNNDSVVRYSDADITYLSAEFTLKEYSQQHGSEILYLDWYEDIHDAIKGCDSSDLNKIVHIQENLIDPQTGRVVAVNVISHNVIIDKFSSYDTGVFETTLSNNIVLSYRSKLNQTMVKFEYGNYKYYIEFKDTSDMDYIRETIESMFKN